jgi:hypothetical protein
MGLESLKRLRTLDVVHLCKYKVVLNIARMEVGLLRCECFCLWVVKSIYPLIHGRMQELCA